MHNPDVYTYVGLVGSLFFVNCDLTQPQTVQLPSYFPNSNLQNGNVCAGSEKYDIEQDSWTTVAAFPGGALSHRSQHASVRFQNVILVSGGLGGGLQDLVLDSVGGT